MKEEINIFWFRRDLRLNDNAGLHQALIEGKPVLPIFIFDTKILSQLNDRGDARVGFIHAALIKINEQLKESDSSLLVLMGEPQAIFKGLVKNYTISGVFANEDYEPYARERDQLVGNDLQKEGIKFHLFKDQVIFAKSDIMKPDGAPFRIFSPYSRAWKYSLSEKSLSGRPSEKYLSNFFKTAPFNFPSLAAIGFEKSGIEIQKPEISKQFLLQYESARNYPYNGTSRLGVHLRFGTISIREVVKKAKAAASEAFLNELIWREFFQMILFHYPEVYDGRCFKKEYELIRWRNNESEFEKWCNGQTGFSFIDAGMRELNSTGFMHNRLRMITASFLCKHLLIDWRWGEAYFAEKLLDYDLASNNGNWQWVAGCGSDSMPYFRIFNPTIQQEKFDKEKLYTLQWVPELLTSNYPEPMVDHEGARERCLAVYNAAIKTAGV